MARRLGPPRVVARRRRARRVRRPTPLAVYPAAAAVLGAVRKAKSDGASARCAPTSTRVVVHDTGRAARARSSPRSPTCATRAASSATSSWSRRPSSSVDVDARRPRVTRRPRPARRAAPGSTRTSTSRPASACRPRRGRRSACPTLERDRARCMELLGSPAARVPGGPPHRHQRQDVGGPDDRRAARGRRALGRLLHEPAPRAGQRAHGRGTASRSPTTTLAELLVRGRARSRTSCPTRPSYFEILTAAALRWFADVAVDVAVVEVGLGGTWDATNVVDADGRRRHQREHRPRRVPRPDARRDRGREGRASSSRARRSCSARPIPSSCRIFLAREPGAVAACATSTSACARNRLAHRRPRRRPVHAARGRTPTCSSRCTARTRPTTRRSRSPRPRRSSARALDAELVADAFARGALTRSARGRRPPAARAARRRAQRRRRARAARRARRGVRRLGRARSSSGCCARRSRTRCSTRSACDDAARARVLPAAEPARARPARRRRRRAATSASTTSIDRRRRRRRATRSRCALEATPADGQVVVTGSLYVVGAARSRARAGA